jgi:hypothetical protein
MEKISIAEVEAAAELFQLRAELHEALDLRNGHHKPVRQ